MAILELCGLKVLPPPDLDDGESLWIGPGAAQPRQCSAGATGFWLGPQMAEAGYSAIGRWLFGEDS